MHSITGSADMRLSKFQKLVTDREAWHAACHPWGHKELDKTEQLNKAELKALNTLLYTIN